MFFNINPQVSFDVSLSSGKVDGFDMLEELIDNKRELESSLAKEFAERLEKQASQHLYSTKNTYIDAISVVEGSVILDTSNFVVGLVEDGSSSFDMKPGHLEGPKVKVNKQGKKYAVVPIGKYKQGRYNWRDKVTGRFDRGQNVGGDVEFRIISENSPQDSWIHPGHEGFHFIHNILQDFESEIDTIIGNKLEEGLNNI